MHHKNDCPYSVEDLHYYVRPIISGTSIVCNQATYSIANLPAGASVTYTLYWNSGLSPKLTSNFPEPTMCLIENTHHYPATGTLKASINIGTGNPIILTKTITTDSNTEVQSGTYEQDACNFHGVYHSSQSGSLPSTVSTPVFLHQGCMTRIKLNEMSGRTVTYTGIEQPLYWNYQAMNNTLYLQLPLYSGGVPFTFKIKGDGACKDKTLLFFSYSNNSKYTFAVAPNPVKDVLTIYAHPNNELIEQKGVDLSIEELEYDIAIYNVNMPKLLHCEKGIRGQKERKVNVAKLRKGYYILQIKEKEEIQTLKFFKE
ncbi:MAG: hypothetical protein CSA05_01475 [Bacteroidia bacterium]|nr:MAG: hypothetical protein CSB01_01285 [Bacteroidia bacterium]PIE86211.1 MAG: hypothetical protein CSA05_01475 [Bacteroidia bacterium]